MFLYLSIILIGLLAQTNTTRPRSINLALETVLEFQNEDISADIKFLDKVQNFLSKVKKSLINRPRRRQFQEERVTFTDFLKEVVKILLRCKDEDIEDVMAVFEDEVRKYHYRGCKFYELFHGDQDLKKTLGEALDSMKHADVDRVKTGLQAFMDRLSKTKQSIKTLDFYYYINSLYIDKDKHFKRFLSSFDQVLKKSKRTNKDLVRVIREGLRTLVFDHYTHLNVNTRRELKLKLQDLLKEYTNNMNDDLSLEYGKDEKFGIKVKSNKIDIENIKKIKNSLYKDNGDRDGIAYDKKGKHRQRETYSIKNHNKKSKDLNSAYKHKNSEEKFWDNLQKMGITKDANTKPKDHRSVKINNIIKNNNSFTESNSNFNKKKPKYKIKSENENVQWENDGMFTDVSNIEKLNKNKKHRFESIKSDKISLTPEDIMEKSLNKKHKTNANSKSKEYTDVEQRKEKYKNNYNIPNNKENNYYKILHKDNIEIGDYINPVTNNHIKNKIQDRSNQKKVMQYKAKSKIKNKYAHSTRELFKKPVSDSSPSDTQENDKRVTIYGYENEMLQTQKSNTMMVNLASKGSSHIGKNINKIINLTSDDLKYDRNVIITQAGDENDINKRFKNKNIKRKFETGTKTKIVKAQKKRNKTLHMNVKHTTNMTTNVDEEDLTNFKTHKEEINSTTNDRKIIESSTSSDSNEEIVKRKIQETEFKYKKSNNLPEKRTFNFVSDTSSESDSKFYIENQVKGIKLPEQKSKKHENQVLKNTKAKNSLRNNFHNKDPEIRVKYTKNIRKHKVMNDKSFNSNLQTKFFVHEMKTTRMHRVNKYKSKKHGNTQRKNFINVYHKPDPAMIVQDSYESIKRNKPTHKNRRKNKEDLQIQNAAMRNKYENFLNMTDRNSFEDATRAKYITNNEYNNVALRFWDRTGTTETVQQDKTAKSTNVTHLYMKKNTSQKITNKFKKETSGLDKSNTSKTDTRITSTINLNSNQNTTLFIENSMNENNTSTENNHKVTIISKLDTKTKNIGNNNNNVYFRATNFTKYNITSSKPTTENDKFSESKDIDINKDKLTSIDKESINNQNISNNYKLTKEIPIEEKNITKDASNHVFKYANTILNQNNLKSNLTRRKNDLEDDSKTVTQKGAFTPMSLTHQVAKLIINESNIIESEDGKYKGVKDIIEKDLESIFVISTTTTEKSTTVTDSLDVIEDALGL